VGRIHIDRLVLDVRSRPPSMLSFPTPPSAVSGICMSNVPPQAKSPLTVIRSSLSSPSPRAMLAGTVG
jgi:hypothetical protein